MSVLAYIGLGSNLGDRAVAIAHALEAFELSEDIDLVAASPVVETDPVGPVDQGRFLNGVAAIRTELSPRALLERLLQVERSIGRDRSAEVRWGPRRIDLDLLLYGDVSVDEPGLTVPHPRLRERLFVLEPLAALAPDLILPAGLEPISQLLLQLRASAV